MRVFVLRLRIKMIFLFIITFKIIKMLKFIKLLILIKLIFKKYIVFLLKILIIIIFARATQYNFLHNNFK